MKKTNFKDYKNLIGDGKLPNHYWVFEYDERMLRSCDLQSDPEWINGDSGLSGGLVGHFKTYGDAMGCAYTECCLDHIVIEDRLTGVIFEQYVEVCPCGKNVEYITIDDSHLTKKDLGEDFK